MDPGSQRKERLQPPGYTNGGSNIPLGSEGSSRDSEVSSGEGHLPDTVDITVILPDNTSKLLTVDYGKQMMDFLVQVAATHKLSPATHTFQLFSEETGRPVEYYASQSVGAMGIPTFHLVQKKSELQKKRERQRQSAQPTQPFEITHRLTVNLPKNQKMLTRISPKCTLAELFKMICSEKNLDPYKYELRHPTKPDLALNMASPLGDYGLVEITVVPVGPEARCSSDYTLSDTTDFAHTPVSAGRHGDVSSSVGLTMERKKKKGIFSLFSRKKEGKFKPNEATYSDSTSTLPSSSKSSTSSPSFVDTGHHNSTSSVTHSTPSPSVTTLHAEPSTTKTVLTNNNNVHKGAVPSKPPRKKRQAPLPPAMAVLSSQQPPSSASVTSQPQDPLALRSRTSSHSSGFESAGSPNMGGDSPREKGVIDANVIISETSGTSLRAVQKAQGSAGVKPKVATTKKKRQAPQPPGVSRLRLGSDGSAPSEIDTTPASTPRETDHTITSGEARTDDEGVAPPLSISTHHPMHPSSLTESPHLRPRPVFTAPPPPDTPPPPEVMTSDDLQKDNGSAVDLGVTDSSTQVHVNTRNSLSSEVGSRHNSLSIDMVTDIFTDPGVKTDMTVFTEKMSSLTENIDDTFTKKTGDIEDIHNSSEHLHQAPEGFDHVKEAIDHTMGGIDHKHAEEDADESFTKDSLHESMSSDSVSLDNYDFNNEEKATEPALPDLNDSVVLVKKTSLNEDSFYSDSKTRLMTESQDSGVGTVRDNNLQVEEIEQVNKNNEESLNMSEEITSPIDLVSHSSFEKPRGFSASDDNVDRFSVDSLDMINSVTPTSDSGFSGSLERNTSGQEHMEQRLSVTEEITIDQSEVMYIAPGGPKPDLEQQKMAEKSGSQIVEKPEEVVKEEEARYEESTQEVQQDVETEEVSQTGTVEMDTENNQEMVEREEKQPTVFIIEKTKLNQDIRNLGLPEPPKEKRPSHPVTSISSTLADRSLDPDYRKFLSYVESAKQKTGEVGQEMPVSPDSKTSGTSFFVEFEETKPHKSALHSQSLDSFSSYSRPESRADAFSYAFPERRENRKSDFRITTLEYKPEARKETSARVNSLRDIYHKPVGKTASLESEDSRPKSMYSAVPSSPSYSFYKTEVKSEPPKKESSNKRSSTVILMRKDQGSGSTGQTQPRRSGMFIGPRPYGAKKQISEPSVRDVRKALSIYETKVDSDSSSKGSNRGTPTKEIGGDVRERCSKLGFSPSGEQESDSFLEEKSISQIALPAQRRVVSKATRQQQRKEVQQRDSPNFGGSAVQLSTKSDSMENLGHVTSDRSLSKMTKSTENVYAAAAGEKSRKTLQSQYDDLEQQFSKWQTQLLHNQSLLNERTPNKMDSDTPQSEVTTVTGQLSSTDQDRGMSSSSRRAHPHSEFNRRSTIDVVESGKPLLYEVERRERMFDRTDHRPAASTRLEELKFRRHEGGRYSSLTEGIAVNTATDTTFSQEELAQAKTTLRQNSTEDKGGASTRFKAEGSVTPTGSKLGRSGISRSEWRATLEAADKTQKENTKKTVSDRSLNLDKSTSKTESLSDSKPLTELEKIRGYRFRRPIQRHQRDSADILRFVPKLDPREELMIAIRSAGGRGVLRKVTVDETKWT